MKINSTINIANMCLVDLSGSSVGLNVCANERRVHDRCACDGRLDIMIHVNNVFGLEDYVTYHALEVWESTQVVAVQGSGRKATRDIRFYPTGPNSSTTYQVFKTHFRPK
jgi:hypothetical protein